MNLTYLAAEAVRRMQKPSLTRQYDRHDRRFPLAPHPLEEIRMGPAHQHDESAGRACG